MHAVVINVTIADRTSAEAELSEVVPRVSGQVAGIEAAPAGAVTLDSVDVGEVVAHA
jgi:hypothetical protein